jgi:hypothetical protein
MALVEETMVGRGSEIGLINTFLDIAARAILGPQPRSCDGDSVQIRLAQNLAAVRKEGRGSRRRLHLDLTPQPSNGPA